MCSCCSAGWFSPRPSFAPSRLADARMHGTRGTRAKLPNPAVILSILQKTDCQLDRRYNPTPHVVRADYRLPLHSLGRKESTIVLNGTSCLFQAFSGHPSVRFHSLFLFTDKVLSSRRPPPLNSKSWQRRTMHEQGEGGHWDEITTERENHKPRGTSGVQLKQCDSKCPLLQA